MSADGMMAVDMALAWISLDLPQYFNLSTGRDTNHCFYDYHLNDGKYCIATFS